MCCSSGVTVNGNSVNIGSGNTAAIDTGTTLIGAPTAAVNAIWGAVSGAQALSGNMTGFWAFRTYTFRPPPWRWFGGNTRQGGEQESRS